MMNFLDSFLGSSVPPKMDSTVDTHRQFVAAMPPKSNAPAQRATAAAASSSSGAADAAFLNSQLVGGPATSGAHNPSTNRATTSHSFYRHEDRLLDPDFIDHLAEYSDTEEGPDDDWGNYGAGDDEAHLESGFTPENVFGPTEDDASSKAMGRTTLNPKKPSVTTEGKYQYQETLANPQVYTKPAPTITCNIRKAASQKRKSFTLTDEEPTMYIPDDMITIAAYMGPPAEICPPTSNNSHRRNSKGNMSEEYDYSDSESSDDEEDTKKPAASSTCGDHADPFSKLAESSARTETTRRYLEESRRMYSSIPDFHRYSNTERVHSVPATNNTPSSSFLDDVPEPNMNASFNSSGFNSKHNSATSFHNSFSSSTGTLTIPEINPSCTEHQSRMSNLLTAMERTEHSRALLRRRSEAVTSASTVSASGITSLHVVMGRVGGPRKSRGASPPRSYQRLF